MAISLRHEIDLSDFFPSQIAPLQFDLLDLERSIRKETGCDRMNVVKFGNVAKHLHWHLIPRYREECFPKLNPWEILADNSLDKSNLYLQTADSHLMSEGLRAAPESLVHRVISSFQEHQSARAPGFFGASMILRSADPSQRSHWATQDLSQIAEAARTHPEAWETLLMLQNYGLREWDHFGGNGDPGEFPSETAVRELFEESGWDVSESTEVCRQWSQGIIKGFVYLTRPQTSSACASPWWTDNPDRNNCREVDRIGYFNLQKLCQSGFPEIPEKVRLRHVAFLERLSDFRWNPPTLKSTSGR